MDELAAKHQ